MVGWRIDLRPFFTEEYTIQQRSRCPKVFLGCYWWYFPNILQLITHITWIYIYIYIIIYIYIGICYFSSIQVSPLFYLGIAKNREMKESPQISGWSRWSWDFWVFHPRDSWDFEGYTQIFFGRAQKEALDWMLNSLKLGRLGWYTYITYIYIITYILYVYITYILYIYYIYYIYIYICVCILYIYILYI